MSERHPTAPGLRHWRREADAQGIVFNGHYLTYLDTAVSGYWRALAIPYADTMKQLGGDLYVRRATLDYRGSARYDDRLDIAFDKLPRRRLEDLLASERGTRVDERHHVLKLIPKTKRAP